MSINVTCEKCGSSYLANDRLAGRRVRCPTCDATVEIPVQQEIGSETSNLANEVTVAATNALVSDVIMAANERPLDSPPQVLTNGNSKVTPSTPGPEEDDEEPVYEKKMRAEEEMDMTPMVDVTFLLLIFFMVTAAFSLQKAIQVPRQQTDVPSTSVQEEEVEELDMVEVQIDEFGSFLVMAPEWERETPGKQNLISALREAITGNKDGMRLVVKVHELAKLHALVDAMDAGTIAGYSQLEVTQVEEFD